MTTQEDEISRSLKRIKSLHSDKFFYRKLYDTQSFLKINAQLLSTKQPADFYAIFKGTVFFIECKSTHNLISFNFDFIQQHQFEDLIEAENAGAICYLLINSRGRDEENITYVVKPQTMLALRETYHTQGRRSIKFTELLSHCFTIKRVCRDQLWLLEPIFGTRVSIT